MKYLYGIVYLIILTIGTFWLINQTGNYWWVLAWSMLLPKFYSQGEEQ